MMIYPRTLVLFSMLLLLAGCKSSEDTTVSDDSYINVRVTNRNFVSVEVYAVGASRRALLGRLSPGATKTYDLPKSILDDDYSIRFQIESVDRTLDILTDPVVAVPGEEIILVIPNER